MSSRLKNADSSINEARFESVAGGFKRSSLKHSRYTSLPSISLGIYSGYIDNGTSVTLDSK